MDSSEVLYVSFKDAKRCDLCLISAIVSLVFLATGAFISGRYTYNPILSVTLTSSGYLAFTFIFLVVELGLRKLKSKTNLVKLHGFPREPVSITNSIKSIILGGILFSLGLDFMLLGYFYEPEGHGVISTISVMSILVFGIYSYYYNFIKLKWVHYLGIFIASVGFLVIAIKSLFDDIWPGIICAVISMLCFGFSKILAYKNIKSGIDIQMINIIYALLFALVSWLIAGIIKIAGIGLWSSNDSLL